MASRRSMHNNGGSKKNTVNSGGSNVSMGINAIGLNLNGTAFSKPSHTNSNKDSRPVSKDRISNRSKLMISGSSSSSSSNKTSVHIDTCISQRRNINKNNRYSSRIQHYTDDMMIRRRAAISIQRWFRRIRSIHKISDKDEIEEVKWGLKPFTKDIEENGSRIYGQQPDRNDISIEAMTDDIVHEGANVNMWPSRRGGWEEDDDDEDDDEDGDGVARVIRGEVSGGDSGDGDEDSKSKCGVLHSKGSSTRTVHGSNYLNHGCDSDKESARGHSLDIMSSRVSVRSITPLSPVSSEDFSIDSALCEIQPTNNDVNDNFEFVDNMEMTFTKPANYTNLKRSTSPCVLNTTENSPGSCDYHHDNNENNICDSESTQEVTMNNQNSSTSRSSNAASKHALRLQQGRAIAEATKKEKELNTAVKPVKTNLLKRKEKLNTITKAVNATPHKQPLFRKNQKNSAATSKKTSQTSESTVKSQTVLTSQSLKSTKMEGIMKFLEHLESGNGGVHSDQDEDDDMGSIFSQTIEEYPTATPSVSSGANAIPMDARSHMIAQELEIQDKRKTVAVLKRALMTEKQRIVTIEKENEELGDRRLNVQQKEYESIIKRHLAFIDQLMEEKKTMSERCEKLVKDLKESDKKYAGRIKTLEESHAKELKRQKDTWAAAEKMRRENWINEKTKRIKEITVKGLEPEIQRMITKHKADIKAVKEAQKIEYEGVEERVAERYRKEMEALRLRVDREKEEVREEERKLTRSRLEREWETEEQSFQSQRRRLLEELQSDRDQLAILLKQERERAELIETEMKETHRRETGDLIEHAKKAAETAEKRRVADLAELREKFAVEKEHWQEFYMQKHEAEFKVKETRMRERMRSERDQEIEMVIQRLEDETSSVKLEAERESSGKIKELTARQQAMIKKSQHTETLMTEKYHSAREQIELDKKEIDELRSDLRHKDRQLDKVHADLRALEANRADVTEHVRVEFADRLASYDEDSKQLRTEIAENNLRHESEKLKLEESKEKELDMVNSRVRQIVSRKDEMIRTLRDQSQQAELRAAHLETLLERQRHELLS